MAAMSAVSAVTLGAGKIAATGGKLTKAAKNVETIGNLVSNATNFAVCATATAQIGSRMLEEYAVQGKELSGETLTEALSIGLNVAGMLVSGKGAVDNGSRLTKAISESGATRRMAGKVEGKSETDFYVTPNGDVVPATGYRYISENISYLSDMENSMEIPANAYGTYFSFDSYDIANPDALQVPHDASVKVVFDTLQIMDDISIPYGNWGKASYLEPITIDFPEFGSGGATQAITHNKIKIKSIINLPKK